MIVSVPAGKLDVVSVATAVMPFVFEPLAVTGTESIWVLPFQKLTAPEG